MKIITLHYYDDMLPVLINICQINFLSSAVNNSTIIQFASVSIHVVENQDQIMRIIDSK